jgi:hypothetical protein
MSKISLKISNVCLFFLSFSGYWVIGNFVILEQLKISKHIWEPCSHPVTETGNSFIQIGSLTLIS